VLPLTDYDGFVTPSEARDFRKAVESERSRGEWELTTTGHIGCIRLFSQLQGCERAMLLRLPIAPRPVAERVNAALAAMAKDLDARTRARLELLLTIVDADPALAVAAARSRVPIGPLISWVQWLDRRPVRGAKPTVAAWQPLFELDDPAGPLRADAIAELAPWLWMRQWQLGDRDPGELLSPLSDADYDFAAYLQRFFGRDRGSVQYGADVVARVVVGGGHHVLGASHGDAGRRAAASLARAAGMAVVDAANVPAELRQSATPGLEHAGGVSLLSPLRGLPVESLIDLLLAELDDWTRAALMDEPDWRKVVSESLRTWPELLDAPVFATWWLLLKGPTSTLPLEWLRLHGPRLAAMSPGLQRNVAMNLQRTPIPWYVATDERERLELTFFERNFADGSIVPPLPTFRPLLELALQGSQDPGARFDRACLALAGLPSRVVERGDRDDAIEVWWKGRWVPYPGPLP
jgi:hypothetical protein